MLDRVFTAAFFVFLLAGCDRGPFYFRVTPIDARVIDANTKLPIQGAIVTANWQLVSASLDGPRRRGQLDIQEVVTDQDGRFHLDGFSKPNFFMYELRNEDPGIRIYALGYAPMSWVNPGLRERGEGTERSSPANGMTFSLTPLNRSSPDYFKTMQAFVHSMSWLTFGFECEWKSVPRMVIALDRISRDAQQAGHSTGTLVLADLAGQERRFGAPYCGSATEYLEPWK